MFKWGLMLAAFAAIMLMAGGCANDRYHETRRGDVHGNIDQYHR